MNIPLRCFLLCLTHMSSGEHLLLLPLPSLRKRWLGMETVFFLFLLKITLLFLMCVSVLPECMSANYFLMAMSPEEAIRSPGVSEVVICHVGAGRQTWSLWKSVQCSSRLNRLSSCTDTIPEDWRELSVGRQSGAFFPVTRNECFCWDRVPISVRKTKINTY